MKGWRYKLVDFSLFGLGNRKYVSFHYYDDENFSYGYEKPVLNFKIYGSDHEKNSCEIIRYERASNNHFIKVNIEDKSIKNLLSKSVDFIIDDGYDVDISKVPSEKTIESIVKEELK